LNLTKLTFLGSIGIYHRQLQGGWSCSCLFFLPERNSGISETMLFGSKEELSVPNIFQSTVYGVRNKQLYFQVRSPVSRVIPVVSSLIHSPQHAVEDENCFPQSMLLSKITFII
jgi:hypothetical protein